MSPEKAKVIIVDDSQDYRESLSEFLGMVGHTVVAEAGSLNQALELVNSLHQGDVDVALIDGNLSHFSQGGFDDARVAEAFREKLPGVPLFSISLDEQQWSDDPSLTKRDGSWVIAERVTKA